MKNLLKNFRFKHIWQEPLSTVIGIWIAYLLYQIVKMKVATFLEISPAFIFVLGFLFYARRNKRTPK